MSKNCKYNWPKLFAGYDQSGLSQVEFCQQQDLNPKYFNIKLNQKKKEPKTGFSPVAIEPSQPVSLEVGQCKIHCPDAMPIPSFVLLVKSLS